MLGCRFILIQNCAKMENSIQLLDIIVITLSLFGGSLLLVSYFASGKWFLYRYESELYFEEFNKEVVHNRRLSSRVQSLAVLLIAAALKTFLYV